MQAHKQDGLFQKAEWCPVIRRCEYHFAVRKNFAFVNSVILPAFHDSLGQSEMFSGDVTEKREYIEAVL